MNSGPYDVRPGDPNASYPVYLPEQPGRLDRPPSDRWARPLAWCCGGCALMSVLLAVAIFYGVGAFYRWGVSDDLGKYRTIIKVSKLADRDKQQLIQRIDRIDRKISEGKLPSWMGWSDHDDKIKRLIEKGEFSADDLKALISEFDAIERELAK